MSRTRYARSGELRIAYELRGTMRRWRPWLVLIQGMGFDRSGWEPVLGKLRRHFRLVLVDNRGTGRSGRPAGSFTVADMAGDVLAVLDAAGIGRAHVLGASLGGMVAQELAVDLPGASRRLVLACTTPGWPLGYPMPGRRAAADHGDARSAVEAASRRHAEHALSARTVQHRPEVVDRLVEVQDMRPVEPGAGRPRRWPERRYTGPPATGTDWGPHAGGPRHRRYRGGPTQRQLGYTGCIPGACMVTFPGLGHLLFWEDPVGFAAIVTSFLLDAEARPQHRNVPPALPGRALHRGWQAARQLRRLRHSGSRIRQPDHVPLQRLRQRRPV